MVINFLTLNLSLKHYFQNLVAQSYLSWTKLESKKYHGMCWIAPITSSEQRLKLHSFRELFLEQFFWSTFFSSIDNEVMLYLCEKVKMIHQPLRWRQTIMKLSSNNKKLSFNDGLIKSFLAFVVNPFDRYFISNNSLNFTS